MASADKPHLPFRWSFIPQQNARDGTIRWSFDSFTECIEDAKSKGYGAR